MANSAQARKRVRQSVKRTEHNKGMRTAMRSAIKKVLKATRDRQKDEAATLYTAAKANIDSMVSKGMIHKNKAARIKSRLNKRVKALAA